MLSKNQLKYFRSLQHKKNRNEEKVFLAEGEKIVNEILAEKKNELAVRTLLALPEFLSKEKKLPLGVNVLEINEKELKKISTLSSPNKAILEIRIPEYSLNLQTLAGKYSIFLENIQDPGNLGTIIRTADWFGIENIICSPGSVDLYNPKVIQATMGSFIRVKVHYREPVKLIEEIKDIYSGYQLIAAVLGGRNIYRTPLTGSGMIFFGNESKGLSRKICKRSDLKVSIPGVKSKSGPESLNLSVAVGIIGSELSRQGIIQNES